MRMRQHLGANWPIYLAITIWLVGMALIGLKNGWT